MISVDGSYCPLCGTELGSVEIEKRERRYCANCDRVVWRTARPVTGVAVVDETRVLCIRRVTDPYSGSWAVPGGALEYDEHPATGAVRELREETGLHADAEDIDLLSVRHSMETERAAVRLRYVVPRTRTRGDPAALTEVSDVRYGTPEEFAATEGGVSPLDRATLPEASGYYDRVS